MVLLTGSLEEDRKRATRRHIAQGNAQLVIGTHALIEETVEFAKLGLIVVDEQHRFGVMQRWRLMRKPSDTALSENQKQQQDPTRITPDASDARGSSSGYKSPDHPIIRSPDSSREPDVLVMTATPIPRTLALTLYGDLDVSVLDELPPGRTSITTRCVPDERWSVTSPRISLKKFLRIPAAISIR